MKQSRTFDRLVLLDVVRQRLAQRVHGPLVEHRHEFRLVRFLKLRFTSERCVQTAYRRDAVRIEQDANHQAHLVGGRQLRVLVRVDVPDELVDQQVVLKATIWA